MKPNKVWIAGLPGLALASMLAVAPLAAHEGRAHPKSPPAATAPTTPLAAPAATTSPPSAEAEAEAEAMEHDRPRTAEGRLLAWLGGWHPAAVHFPVALVLTAAFLEALAAVRRRPAHAAGVRLLLAVAAAGAVVAAPLGWANAGPVAPDDSVALTIHRWLGTALPFLLLALWALKRPAEPATGRSGGRLYAALLVLAVGLILAQAYYGAEVTHGAGHMAL